jgi:CheY-like chemotaxis protein
LLIENTPSETNDIKRAIEEMKLKSPFVHTNNTEDALTYLKDHSNRKSWLLPFGLDSQNTDGPNHLKIINNDNLKKIPTVIFSESNESHRIAQCFEPGAAGYIVKPQNPSKITVAIGIIMDYRDLSKLSPEGI